MKTSTIVVKFWRQSFLRNLMTTGKGHWLFLFIFSYFLILSSILIHSNIIYYCRHSFARTICLLHSIFVYKIALLYFQIFSSIVFCEHQEQIGDLFFTISQLHTQIIMIIGLGSVKVRTKDKCHPRSS
ncbi:hypothetical protein BLOT_012216 [Blomia tropicalis]|nr:hypothetical protein BLOT_012216 [Blomia tropicalis]